ncbi:hypothetical protein [Xylophilus sp. GOD-11R]|uniref:hypothetical protein n=1 Tax=Xylophilus sp. GOD-11R TaxID=3089814 RepID=UPI00298BF0DA|nr:hypothetical protein [Xylophilus sp. GOD-11R]WPB55039.1 hypothetical protein R9X41_12750 [Xylophilus sp. GOD-11R]
MSIASFPSRQSAAPVVSSMKALESRMTVELERLLSESLRTPGTRHEVLAVFLTASDRLLQEIPSNKEEHDACFAIRSRRANSLRDMLGITAKYC